MPTLTDLSTIRDLCARYDFALSKGFGQNFIINPGICPRIADEAGIGPGWGALEVGPGIGVLTEQLCKRADKVVSIEVDKRLPPLLEETMADYDNFKLVLNDVLKVDLKALLTEEFGDKPVAVCANLPYYITSPILMRLLEEKLPIENITVMVQKEAAQRLCAAPGTRDAGAISYAVAYYAEPKLLFTVQPGSFYPAPKVTSAVIRLNVRKTPAVEVPGGDEKAFFSLIRAAFSQRRKTAANAISNGLQLPKTYVKEKQIRFFEIVSFRRKTRSRRTKECEKQGFGGNATNKQMHKRVPVCPACRYAMGQKKARRTRLV